jgi:predicted O-methyltransferase YrrM
MSDDPGRPDDSPGRDEAQPAEGPPGMMLVADAIAAMQPFARTTPYVRKMFQDAGLNIEICNYYSPIPTVDDITGSFEYESDGLPYCDPKVFHDRRLARFLEKLSGYAREFNPEVEGDFDTAARFFWANPMFSHADAMAYYCMIRLLRPRRIVEIGSGISALIALEALERNGRGTLTCIEPYPREFLKRAVPRLDRLIVKKAQEMPLAFFNDELGNGDILFIDTTHTVKIGSDCIYLYLKILPYLKPKVMIHAHDIFLPRAFPQDWALIEQLYWTEPYLLYALLLDNPKFRVMYGAQYHMARHHDRLEAMMGGKYPAIGCSLWFRRV